MKHMVTNKAARKLLRKYKFDRVLTFCSGSSKTHANKFDLTYTLNQSAVGMLENVKDVLSPWNAKGELKGLKEAAPAIVAGSTTVLGLGGLAYAACREEAPKGILAGTILESNVGKGIAAAGTVAALAGIGFAAKKYLGAKKVEDDSETDETSRDVDLGSSSKKSGKKNKKGKNGKNDDAEADNSMMMYYGGGALFLVIVIFCLLQGGDEDESSEELEGEDLV